MAESDPKTKNSKSPRPNFLTRIAIRFDYFQRSHRFAGLPFAIIKKYGEDKAGYQAALITYYGFWSLFPLLLVAATVLQMVLSGDPDLQHRILSSLNDYFPTFGNQLQDQISTVHRSGVMLAIGLILTLYGARGGADALRNALNHLWQVPRVKRPGFPHNVLNSFIIIVLGGAGLIAASSLSSYASGLDRAVVFRLVSLVVSWLMLIGVFWYIFRLATSKKLARKDLFTMAIVAATGIQLLQILGGYIVTHQLKHLSSLYGTFAFVLGLLFWIYLQAQVIIYAVEVAVVRSYKLWPRTLLPEHGLTEGDKKAYTLQAEKERFLPPEHVDVSFRTQP